MGVADALAVFRLEFRRYLRWRPLRRWLFGWTLLCVLLAASVPALVAQGEAFPLLRAWRQMVLGLLYVSPTWVGFSSAILLTQRIAWDEARRGELPDLYLTALSPFAIALGKVAACWALTGILMAAAAPASALTALLMGVPLGRWLSALAIGWVMHFWVCAAVYRLQWRTVPPMEAVHLYPLRLNSASAVVAGLGIVAFSLCLQVFAVSPIPATLPIVHLLPWNAMLHADGFYPTPVGQVSAWAFLSLVSLLGGLVFIAAGAQWLGGWSLWGYRFQRIVGGALLIATATLCFATIAPQSVFHPRSGERLFFWGLFVCLLVGVLLTRYVLGYYGTPRGHDDSTPTGGMVREWVLFGTLAILTAWVIQASSGVALNGARLAALGFYLGGWLYLVQQVLAGIATTRIETQHSAGSASTRQRVVAEIRLLQDDLGCLAHFMWLAVLILSPGLRSLFYYPLLITPLGGFLSLDFPAWAYWVYGLYTALLGVALVARRKQASTQATG
ncbi:MAG: hypothetical protein K6U77_04610 [Armatimonadetes bacterium]|nr:hypothetical protein [Armatimonadota bacterium]